MPDFMLIDLDSQADAVARYVWGWKAEDILNWMSQYGSIAKIKNPYDDRLYVLCSMGGIKTPFRFTENDEIIILREHTTYRPRPTF